MSTSGGRAAAVRRDGVFPKRIAATPELHHRKAITVTVIVLTMIAVLLVAGLVAGLVLVGMEGRGGDRAPKLQRHMTRAARHLNGEAKPPTKFVRIVESSLSR